MSSAWPAPITAITLFVHDVQTAARFYRDVFGLPVHYEDDVSVVFDFGGTIVNLLAVSEAPGLIGPAGVGQRESGARMQLTITVGDVDAVCTELAGRGVALLNGPQDRPWGIRTAAFADPDGHVWEVAS